MRAQSVNFFLQDAVDRKRLNRFWLFIKIDDDGKEISFGGMFTCAYPISTLDSIAVGMIFS